MKKYFLLILLLFFAVYSNIFANDFNYNKHLSLTAFYLSTGAANLYFDPIIQGKLTKEELNSLDVNNVNPLDRMAIGSYRKNLDRLSDWPLLANFGFTNLLILNSKNIKENYLLLTEIFALNYSLAKWTKTLTKRKRPYVYSTENSFRKRTNPDAQHSFYSLHASAAFTIAAYNILILKDRNDLNYLNTSLTILPALLTNYLRYKSSQHFVTDILVGSVVGAGITYLIYDCSFLENESTNDRNYLLNVNFHF